MIAFPRRQLPLLQELGAKVLESRPVESDTDLLAKDLLAGFYDVCMRAGLDGVLVELGGDLADPFTLAEMPQLRADLVTRLGNKAEFDARGPRTAKPKQLADCMIAVLALGPTEPVERTITLTDELKREFTKALASVVDAELATPQIRETIIATARGLCDPNYHKSFDKLSAQLDERGMRMPQHLKIPLDAVQAVQKVLAVARTAVVEKSATAAIDRAKQVLARANPEAAERIDQPITHKLTPREVAIKRVSDARAPKAPEAVVQSLFDSLTELAVLSWPAAVQIGRPYSPSHTFAVGELIDHPKFGRGTVKTVAIQRVEVEFPEGTFTLVHARGGK